MQNLVVILALIFPLVWLLAEFKYGRSVRIVLGLGSLVSCLAIAYVVGGMTRLNYNAWYGAATHDLLERSVDELRAGRSEHVAGVLADLHAKFEPRYETRAHYDELVKEAIKNLAKPAIP